VEDFFASHLLKKTVEGSKMKIAPVALMMMLLVEALL